MRSGEPQGPHAHGIDLDQLRRNLTLSPTQRVEKMVSLFNQLSEVRGLAVPESRRADALEAVTKVGDGPARTR